MSFLEVGAEGRWRQVLRAGERGKVESGPVGAEGGGGAEADLV